MAQYRKKSVVINAVRWTGKEESFLEAFCPAVDLSARVLRKPWKFSADGELFLDTNHGPMHCEKGDWVIISPENEYYPCRDSVFRSLYDPLIPENAIGTPQDADESPQSASSSD